ncbi:MAG: hypothetical protein NZ846_02520 [Thermus sp.]|uniref:hypothetical protein n=1 Tax=Thermus sp. TaxID=275 RepID=UPI0025F7D49D|nr:hypothetical protein [Thermus sp.]MCS7217836.1 hypothetical protein [Thermus sp.]MDW8017869.1 hypothetical protein [Thermus sp.]MDW8356553.1 hypothetical protein [Thermus sp.]
MRTVKELRLAGLFAYLAALVLGLLFSYFLHTLLGSGGRLGWGSFNFAGLLEGVGFLLAFTFALYLAKKAVRVPCTTLLTAGLLGPTPAFRLAKPLPRVEGLEAYEGRGIALLVQEGKPVGLLGLAEPILPLEEVPAVEGEVAASELFPLFFRQPLVLVVRGEEVLGAIPREAFFRSLGV